MCVQKKIVIEGTRDLIYLKFVATDFFPKIITPCAGENSGDEWAEQIWSGWSKFGVRGANLKWVEQIWSGWSKFGEGGADVGRTVWRVADYLEMTLLCKFLCSWANFLKLDTYICWFSCEI